LKDKKLHCKLANLRTKEEHVDKSTAIRQHIEEIKQVVKPRGGSET
jgi:hypothetical protein